MYTPSAYRQEDLTEIRAFVQANSFGILINQTNGRLWGTHIPMELEIDAAGTEWLVGHVARANPQGKYFREGEEILTIFPGPHAYISSSWYSYEEVPTWNYLAVHAYGTIQLLDEAALFQALKRLIDTHEQHSEQPVAMERFSAATQRQMRGVIGFKVQITEWQASYKLSQKEQPLDRNAIIDQLETRNRLGDTEIVKAMRNHKS